MVPNFQIVELKYAHPLTGMRFWIEWEVEKTIEVQDKSWRSLFGLFEKIKKTTVIEWEIFSDPASTETNTGYKTIIDASFVIDRYRINMKPIIHKY